MRIGFIGLGVMGRPMAGHLITAGHDVYLNRVKEASQHLVEAGGKPLETARQVAEASEIVILMLPDTPDVEAVLFGEVGVAQGLSAGKLVIDMSSISPVATKTFASRIGELGGAMWTPRVRWRSRPQGRVPHHHGWGQSLRFRAGAPAV
jgi:2-hydroxy-3-oxopropionate reductase